MPHTNAAQSPEYRAIQQATQPLFSPQNRTEQRVLTFPTQDVKPFFQFDGVCQIHVSQGIACDTAVMVQQRGGLDVLRRKRVQTTYECIVLSINNRRTQPFEPRGIAFPQQTQRLADVPAADVKPLVFDKFKGGRIRI